MPKADAVPEKPKSLALPSERGKVVDVLELESEKSLNRFRSLLPRASEALRFARVAIISIVQGPKELRQCTYESIQASIIQAAEAGLELGTPLMHAWLVPYKGQAKLIVGYQGYLHLCYQTARVLDVTAECLYEKELPDFVWMRDPEPVFRHKPYMGVDSPGQVVAAYAVATLGAGKGSPVYKVTLVRKFELDRVSAGKKTGLWVDHYDEMAKKTAIRRMVKTLAKTSRLSRAMAADFDYEGIEESRGKELTFDGKKGVAGVKERLSARVVDSTAKELADDGPPMGMATGDPGHVPEARR